MCAPDARCETSGRTHGRRAEKREDASSWPAEHEEQDAQRNGRGQDVAKRRPQTGLGMGGDGPRAQSEGRARVEEGRVPAPPQ